MTFLEHLDELRTRLIRCVVVVVVAFGVCMAYSKELYKLVEAPIKPFMPEGVGLVFTTLTSPFFTYMKVAFLAGIFLAAPYVLSELWLFVSPGLYKHERKYAVPFVVAASLLFVGGGAFAYEFVFPATCRFFLEVGADFTPMIRIDEYLSLFSTIILVVGAVFEIPAVMFLVARAGLVTARTMLRGWRFAVFFSFVAAAILTPTPDPVTCSAVAVPMIALYFFGIVVAWLAERRPEPPAGPTEPSPPA